MLCYSLSAVAQPRLTFHETMLDAGTLSVSRNDKCTVVFVGKNTGTQPLTLETAETSCPCAEIKMPKKALKPGKEAKIKVTFHAKDLDDRGVVSNIISIFYRNAASKAASSRLDFTRVRVRAELID